MKTTRIAALFASVSMLALAGCSGGDNSSTDESDLKKPNISRFAGAPTTIAKGGSTTLSWSTVNTKTLSINHGVGDVTGTTSITVSPTVTTTYTLTATGAKSTTATAKTTITVTAAAAPKLAYADPAAGSLRLLRNAASTDKHVVLDLVAAQPLSGFGVALNLPLDATRATFTEGAGLVVNPSVLDPGSAPSMSVAKVLASGPLAGTLTVGVARKKRAATDGDVALASGAVLLSLAFDLPAGATAGTVFDGAAPGKGLRAALLAADGHEVVSTAQVGIGKLSVQ